MGFYREMDKAGLEKEFTAVKKEYEKFKELNLSLDMSRGKPSPAQLDLSNALLEKFDTYKSESGFDCRNYGLLDGIGEAKRLFSEIFEVSEDMIIVGGNSSLNMEFDFIAQGMTHGFGCGPWSQVEDRKFLCPAPGYDRHFAITQFFGFELIPVAMLQDGPDMEEVERLVKDPSVKGLWCVPKYSNPMGITFSDEVVERMASLKPAAADFKIMWDNAYTVHHIGSEDKPLKNIFECCKKYGSENMVVEFASTSKMTFAGGGIAALATGAENKRAILSRMTMQTISSDKINQLRHAKMFPNKAVLDEHMKHHAEILTPKFNMVCNMLEKELGDGDILSWYKPDGGYFISIDTLPGCAKRTVELCKEAGVVLTGAGATFPYGNDPLDSNIRIAPSYPSEQELKKATELLIISIKYASLEMLTTL